MAVFNNHTMYADCRIDVVLNCMLILINNFEKVYVATDGLFLIIFCVLRSP